MPKINLKSEPSDQEPFLRPEPRVPEPFENIQVNHCKNPTCPNYGVRASSEVQPRGRYADASKQDGYIRQNDKGLPHLRCKYCGVRFPIKSNQGVYEEKQRCGKYPEPEPEPSCRNEQCTNHGKGLKTHPSLYRSFGKTEAGSKRYRCIGRDGNGEVCNRTFSVPQSTIHRQRMSHINRLVFPFRRYARFWLKKEFEELHAEAVAKAKAEGQKKSRRKKAEFYPSEEERRYAETAMRADIDNPDKISAHIRLPEHGILVRGDYHLYGFFQRIKELVSGAEKLRFFMDQESGIRAACLSAFVPEIRGRKCDAFYVQIARGLRRPIKDKEAENAEAKLEDLCREKKISPKKARLLLLREALHEIKEKGQYGDRWYPLCRPEGIRDDRRVQKAVFHKARRGILGDRFR